MKRVVCNSLCLAFSICFALQSCTKYAFEEEESSKNTCAIQTQVYLNDIWDTRTRGETDETTDTQPSYFMCYLFDQDNIFYSNRGKALKDTGNEVTFTEANKPGSYTIYGITGLMLSECPRKGSNADLTPQTPINIPTPKDICVGKKDVYVTEFQFTYATTVYVDHIMAKVTFLIKNVAPSVESMKVILPKQANQFTLEGNVIGDSQLQTLELQKNIESNDDDTYNWFLKETIVYPYAVETGNMPIQIQVATSASTYTFETESETRCNKGMFVAYSADWNTISYSINTGVVINPWSEKVEGGFNFGTPSDSGVE